MIKEKWWYFAPDGAITMAGPSKWNIVDWEQRRTIAVAMDEQQEDDDDAIRALSKNISTIHPGVYSIHASPDDDVILASTDPKDDETTCPYYPRLDEIQRPEGAQAISRSELREIDHLGPNVDLFPTTGRR